MWLANTERAEIITYAQLAKAIQPPIILEASITTYN